MLNIIHLAAIIFGVLAYFFSDVNSSSSFYNTFLPFIVLISFIYGVLVSINLILRTRNKPSDKSKSTDILLASLKEQGLLDSDDKAIAALKAKASVAQPNFKKVKPAQVVKRSSNIDVAKILASSELPESRVDSRIDLETINQQEWDNPENWSGPPMIAVYFSKRDSRTWVPSQFRLFGRTLNLAKSAAIYWLYFIWFASWVIFFLIMVAK